MVSWAAYEREFSSLDRVDPLQPTITVMIALGFGLLGYFVSRGLVHRLMNKQSIRSYLPICIVVELVEIFCNYMMAAVMIQSATWLQATPLAQRAVLTVLTYIVLSIIPMVGLLLAVVDMDLTISKNGGMGQLAGSYVAPKSPSGTPVSVQPQVKPVVPTQPQPKWTSPTNSTHPTMNMAPTSSYPQGYASVGANTNGAVPPPVMVGASAQGQGQGQGAKMTAAPFSPVQVTK